MSKNKWYLVKVYEIYDRSHILVDKFITQKPNKYSTDMTEIEEIKTKN